MDHPDQLPEDDQQSSSNEYTSAENSVERTSSTAPEAEATSYARETPRSAIPRRPRPVVVPEEISVQLPPVAEASDRTLTLREIQATPLPPEGNTPGESDQVATLHEIQTTPSDTIEDDEPTDKQRAISRTALQAHTPATIPQSMSDIEQAPTVAMPGIALSPLPFGPEKQQIEQAPTRAMPELPSRYSSSLLPVPSNEAPLALRRPRRRASQEKHLRTKQIIRMMHNRRERQEIRRKKHRLGTILGSVFVALLVILLSSGSGYTYAYYQSQQPRVQSLASAQIDQSTHIYDRNGTLLYTLYDQTQGRGTPVSYESIPGVMQDAMIAAEDPTFWSNPGVDPQGILRALEQYFSAGGEFQSGGSTLTQQLIKNLSGDTQITLQRKLSEATLAIGLTQEYPKTKIMEMYFNVSPFGAKEEGVEAAAEDFFGLAPKCNANFDCIPGVAFLDRDLTKCTVTKPKIDDSTCAVDPLLGLARASLLAGMPQNPVIFDPTVSAANIPYALQRQDYVLQQMLDDKMSINLGLGAQSDKVEAITPAIIQQVEALTKTFQFSTYQNNELAPHFVNWVIQTLANDLGDNQDLVNGISVPGLRLLNTGGFNIRTTLDLNLETYIENAITRHLDKPELQEFQGDYVTLSQNNNVHDAAVVVMNAKTGEVLAMDGSASWTDTSTEVSGEINMALTPRQPASSFKTIALAAAYQMGWYPGIVAGDYQTYFPTTTNQSSPVSNANTYAPPDYGGAWHDLNSNLEIGISNSFNIPALKTQYYAGTQNVYDMAARLGITSIDPVKGQIPSMALGTNAVSLLQMTDAYQTFADQGVHIPPHNILDIWDNYGRNLYHYDPTHPNGSQVISPQVAYLVTSTIDNQAARSIEFGGDTELTMDNWTLADGSHPDVAAKTGTSDNFDDNWTIGYTPDVVVGVWAGNANYSGMINSIGITGAGPIWHSVIEYVSGKCNTATDDIPCPKLDFQFSDRHFTEPSGVLQQEVNTYNGLQGYGYDSWMINGDQPEQSGSSFGIGKK
jgi:membrane peptidoglycan carboxypeptidase